MILECEIDFEVPIILRRLFLTNGRALVYIAKGKMKFMLNNQKTTFNIYGYMKQSDEIQTVSFISYMVDSLYEVQIKE